MRRTVKAGVPLKAKQLNAIFANTTIHLPNQDKGNGPLELIGQKRALNAIKLSAEIENDDFNLFVLGQKGYGRHEAVLLELKKNCTSKVTPSDWVYVNNFEKPDAPIAIELPSGRALPFKKAMQQLVDDLANEIPAIFEAEDYQNQRRAIEQDVGEQHEKAFAKLIKQAEEKNLSILRTPMGFGIVAMKDGKPLKPEQFKNLPIEEQELIDAAIDEEQALLEQALKQIPRREKEHRLRIEQLNAEVATQSVDDAITETVNQFGAIPNVKNYLDTVRNDMIENAELFLEPSPTTSIGAFPIATSKHYKEPKFQRYAVNVVVGNGKPLKKGAPIITQELPTLSNLIGRVENASEMGTLVTDFTMIKPGDLHKANGGYLVLDARQVLLEPFAWEALKRCLKTGEISIISGAERIGLITTQSLQPDPIPLNIRVVLVGERILYYLLMAWDPDFQSLFKIAADFDDDIYITKSSTKLYSKMLSQLSDRYQLKPLDVTGLQRVLIEATRLADDSEKLSLNLGKLGDILKEANYWAIHSKVSKIKYAHVEKAICEAETRSNRIRELTQDAIKKEILLIATKGETVGQINALSVMQIGDVRFGRPSRITSRVRMGKGKLVDIEREVELGGAIHSKGVLILSSYLSANYALDVPMSLWASIVFEQSYGGVDGDSASAAELFTLISALTELPLTQSFAVTGSVNQQGEIQAVGGVNEKIEGFFDICKARGLTGNQGVLIPKANVRNLALRQRVIDAVSDGKFSIIPIKTIDQGLKLLTGVNPGKRNKSGQYPKNSVNGLAEAKLRKFAFDLRAFSSKSDKSIAKDMRS